MKGDSGKLSGVDMVDRSEEDPARGRADSLAGLETIPPAAETSRDLRQLDTLAPLPQTTRQADTLAPPPRTEDQVEADDGDPIPTSRPAALSTGNLLRREGTERIPFADTASYRPGASAAPPPRRTAAYGIGDDGRPVPGTSVGKYQLIRELGAGGMGVVHLARDTRLGRRVAIKFLGAQGPHFTERFLAEARTTARCHHENIVVVHEADEHNGHPYMVLEYIEGKSLRDILRDKESRAGADATDAPRPFSVERAVEIMIPVLRALARAHGMGIVHRDLKPANVMLTDVGTVKVLDFGIAKLLADDSLPSGAIKLDTAPLMSATMTGGLLGTLPYMSPEQLAGGLIDHRTDIWAAGIMLFEMLTGQHPMAPLSAARFEEVADVSLPMPRVSELRPDLDRDVAAVIDSCLRKPRAERIGSALALLGELERFLPGRRQAELPSDRSPYAGLAAFQESDAQKFFGRSRDIANVAARVRNLPLVTVIGPSGVGKSSLVRAGVIPALKRSGEGWHAFTIRPGRHPLDTLADLLGHKIWRESTDPSGRVGTSDGNRPDEAGRSGRWSGTMSAQESQSELRNLAGLLAAEPGHLGTELREWAFRKQRRLLLFVDQLEEIYTLGADAPERAAFLACLAAAADDAASPIRVVLSMRSDFLERMAGHRAFMTAVTRGLEFLAPIDRAGLRKALTRPLAAAGYRFESAEIVRNMLDELDGIQGALPLLQFTAGNLWAARDRDRKIVPMAAYEAIGGISGTLARHADAVLAGMTGPKLRLTRTIFERLVTPERTRAVATVAEIRQLPGDSAAITEVLYELADARLLGIETRGVAAMEESGLDQGGLRAGGAVEIIHDSLIESWPTLRRWLDENRDDAEFLDRLRSAARQWHRSGEAEGLLWTGAIAAEARVWKERYRGELPEQERRYLDAVLARADRTQRRRRNMTYGTIAFLLVVILAGTIGMLKLLAQRNALQKSETELQSSESALKAALDDAVQAKEEAEQAKGDAEQALRARDDATAGEDRALVAARKAREQAEAEAKKAREAEAEARDEAIAAGKARDEAVDAKKRMGAALHQAEEARKRETEAKRKLQDHVKKLESLIQRHGIEKPVLR